jgi:hypothetical protein
MAKRSIEKQLRDSIRYLEKGIPVQPLQKRQPKLSSIEKRLIDAKKAFKKSR